MLVSGSGTNLQAIIDKLHGRDGIEVTAVASSKPGVQALERAHKAGIETAVFEASAYPSRALGWMNRRVPQPTETQRGYFRRGAT